MKKFGIIYLLFFVFSVSSVAQSNMKMGIGIATNLNYSNMSSSSAPFYNSAAKFVIDFNEIRIEPFFGMTNRTEEYGVGGTTMQTLEYKQSYFGVNFEYLIRKESSLLFIGIGIGKTSVSRTNEIPINNNYRSSDDLSGIVFTPVIGGDYFFAPEFSAGVEIAYPFYKLEGTEESSSGNNTQKVDQKSSANGINTYFTVKYFFAL